MATPEPPTGARRRRQPITVLLPVRNGGPLLEPAVRSCLADLSPDDRLLILDNGSTDTTEQFSRRVQEEDARVRFVRTDAPDLAAALNVGIDLAETDLLARMDADDVVLPGRFAAQVRAFEEDGDLVLCGTQIKRFTSDPARSRSVTRLPTDHERIVAGLLKGRHVLSHPSVMFRRSAARAVGGYWAHGVSEDCDFFLRLSRLGRLANLPICGLAYRFHGGSLNARKQVAILLGMRYAAATYRRPRTEAPDFADYCRAALADRRSRLALRRSAASDRLYRDAQIRMLESCFSAIGLAELFVAGLLRVDKAVSRLARLLPVRPVRPGD